MGRTIDLLDAVTDAQANDDTRLIALCEPTTEISGRMTIAQAKKTFVTSNAIGRDEVDRVLDSTCAVFGLTEYELDNMPLKKSGKLIRRMTAIFNAPFEPKPRTRIGPFFVQYDPASLSLGQYIEINFFL